MQKTALDPKWLTTPLGGVVGLLITRKTGKRGLSGQVLGTAIGAGGGYILGEALGKGAERMAIGNAAPEQAPKMLREYYAKNILVDDMEPNELALAYKGYDILPGGNTWGIGRGYKKSFLHHNLRSRERLSVFFIRARNYGELANNTNIPEPDRKRYEEASSVNLANATQLSKDLKWENLLFLDNAYQWSIDFIRRLFIGD